MIDFRIVFVSNFSSLNYKKRSLTLDWVSMAVHKSLFMPPFQNQAKRCEEKFDAYETGTEYFKGDLTCLQWHVLN